MKFYVNVFYDKMVRDPEYGQYAVGLFGKHKFEGRGNCCGWYGAEYYLNTILYAHYLNKDLHYNNPGGRLSEVVVCNPEIRYTEIHIGSCYWEMVIEADTVEEAIEKFKNGEWKRG